MGLQAKPRWARILNVYRWVLFAPGRSAAAKVCTAFFVFKVVMAVLELLLPGVGIAYLSRDHLYDVSGHVADGLVWFLALMFVRERDEARAEAKAAKFEYAVKPARISDDRIWEWRARDEGRD